MISAWFGIKDFRFDALHQLMIVHIRPGGQQGSEETSQRWLVAGQPLHELLVSLIFREALFFWN
ncbi:MAG: hypothetical protein O2960_13650 [Verrucomicrobia bacterium]|nr:hypothetical protein [Verrucomicrobiota bacterium]